MLNIKKIVDASQVQKSFYKKYFPKEPQKIKKPKIEFKQLSEQQAAVVNDISALISRPVDSSVPGKLIIINAEGGTGKSVIARHIIYAMAIKKRTDKLFDYLALAYTGIASQNIQACTMHSALHVPAYIQPASLHSQLAKPLDPKFAKYLPKISIVLIDE